MKKTALYLLLVIILFSSCSSFEDIEVEGVKAYTIKSLKDNELKVDLKLEVKNPTLYPITLKDLDLRTQINGRYIGKVHLDEKIKIKAKRESEVVVPVTLKISNIMASAFLMLNMKKTDQLKIDLEGKVKARSYLINKEVEIKESLDLGDFKL